MSGEREHVVDRLRGFALLGILLVNTPFLISSIEGFTTASAPAVGDRLAWFAMATLFQAKSYVVFSFLFGYSLALLLRSIERRGADAKWIYLRRLGGLALFGVLHAILLFPGDILVIYAVTGVVMLPLRKCNDRALLVIAGILFALQAIVLAVLVATYSHLDADSGTDAIDRALGQGSFLEATAARAEVWPFALGLILVLQGFLVAGLFCIGLVCGRHRLLADPERIAPTLRRLRAWGFGLGLPIQIVAAYLLVWHDGDLLSLVGLLLGYVFAPILSAGMIAAIALLPRRGLTRAVEADGRMSLTIYLAESLLLVLLASRFGLGLFGLHALPALALSLLVWLALLGCASVWMRRFAIGPAEALLRAVTYRRPPRLPLHRPTQAASASAPD